MSRRGDLCTTGVRAHLDAMTLRVEGIAAFLKALATAEREEGERGRMRVSPGYVPAVEERRGILCYRLPPVYSAPQD